MFNTEVVYLRLFKRVYTMVIPVCVHKVQTCVHQAPSKRYYTPNSQVPLSFVQSSPSTPHVALRMDNKMFRSATSNLAML